MRKFLVALACAALAACATTAPMKTAGLDAVADDYVLLQLTIGEKQAGYIDAYYGPSEIKARAVAANVGPKLLFRDLIAKTDIDRETREQFLAIKTGSGSFRMNVALAELPDFICRPGKEVRPHHCSGIVVGPTMAYLERAYLDARSFGWSREPVVEMMISSTLDSSLAPPGKHVASLFVQHVAPHLPDGRSWSDAREKEAFADLVVETVSRHAPNFKSAVLARQILSPLDLEERFGLVDGDIFHGQLGLGQLFSARPGSTLCR